PVPRHQQVGHPQGGDDPRREGAQPHLDPPPAPASAQRHRRHGIFARQDRQDRHQRRVHRQHVLVVARFFHFKSANSCLHCAPLHKCASVQRLEVEMRSVVLFSVAAVFGGCTSGNPGRQQTSSSNGASNGSNGGTNGG